jgi:arginine-tRNA-protein transferase
MNKNFSIIRNVENCFFYPGRTWTAEFRQILGMTGESFQSHLEAGYFSRGIEFYKPVCSRCQECVPIRLPVAHFRPSKSQRKLCRQNSDLQLRIGKPRYSDERLDVYARYHRSRWGWLSVDPEVLKPHFCEHLVTDWGGAWEFSFWLHDRLLGFGIVDETPSAANSRYFVYEPELGKQRGLGIYSLLKEIEWCQQLGKSHHYLGMYVASSPSMNYKVDFRPFELRQSSGEWQSLADRRELS